MFLPFQQIQLPSHEHSNRNHAGPGLRTACTSCVVLSGSGPQGDFSHSINVISIVQYMFLLAQTLLSSSPYHIRAIAPSRAGSLTLCHVVSTHPHGSFQPNQGPVSDTSNQKEMIGHVSKSCTLNMSMDDFCRTTFLKSVYLGFSNKNTSLIFFVVLCCPPLY